MLSWPMIAFGWVTNMLQRGMASWKRMLDILDAAPAISDAARDRRRPLGPAHRRHRSPGPGVHVSRSRTIRSSITCRSESRPGRPSRSSAPRDRGSRHSSACCRGCTSRRPERCSWTASTFARSLSRRFAARSASSRRSHSCSRTRSRRTSPLACRWRRGHRPGRPGAAGTSA